LTVGKNIHQTLANLRKSKADMETFALETEDSNAQDMYSNYAQQLEQMINDFSGRVNYVEDEEPQYQVKKEQQNK